MIPPDRSFEEGSAKTNSAFKIGTGVLGLVSICVAVFVIFLCAKKDSNSKRKKVSSDSRQALLENQVSPARHGVDNKMYAVSENGIGESLLDRKEKSVLHGSTPMKGEGRPQNSSPQPSQPLTWPQNYRLTNEKQALYDSPTSNKPIRTMPIESEKYQSLFGRSQSEVNDENLYSDGYIRQDPADELYHVPKSNKPILDKKPLPSPKLLERPKKKLPCASDSVMDVHCELANSSSNYGTSMCTYPNLIQKVDLEKGDDNHHEPWTGRTQEKRIPFSPSREGKLSESESGIDDNTFQHEFNSRTKLEGRMESLNVAPKPENSTNQKKPPWSINLSEEPKMKPLGSKNLIKVSKTTFTDSVQGPDMPVYKHGGNNRKEILDKFDNNYVSSTAISISPSPVKPPRLPLQGSETGDDSLEDQFTIEINSIDAADAPYDVPKSRRPSDDRKPLSLPKLVGSSETKPIDGANTTKELEIEIKEPQTRFSRPIYVGTNSNKRELLEQKYRFQSPLSDKINAQLVILTSSKSAVLSTTRTAPDESKFLTELHSDSDSKKYADKEADPKNNLHKSVPGKQVQNTGAKLGRKPELVSTRGDTIDDDGSYAVLLSVETDASKRNSSHLSTKDDPSLYKNNMFPFPVVDLPPPPPPCHFSYVNVPNTMVSKQNKSVTNDVDSETEDHPKYINCAEFSKRNDNLKRLKETNICPPDPCLAQRYINISHTSSKKLEEDTEYVAMNNHVKLDSQATDNSIAKYANIQDIHVPQTPETDSDMYLPMTKHLTHANSDTYLYQNGGNTKLKENKNLYVNSSFSTEGTQKELHDSEQDDTYSYVSADFFLKNKMAANAADKSDDCTHDGKAQKSIVRSTSFRTETSAKEKGMRTQTSKPQKLQQTVIVSKTVLAGKPGLETVPPPQNATYK